MTTDNNNQITLQDILIAMNEFSTHIDQKLDEMKKQSDARFDMVDKRLDSMEKKFEARFEKIEADIEQIKARLASLENQMVTKEYMDRRLADLRADFGGLVRKEDAKVDFVIDKLEEKSILNSSDTANLKANSPFVKV